jgi:hypothetical protein
MKTRAQWTPDWPKLESMYADYIEDGASWNAVLLQELQYQIFHNTSHVDWMRAYKWYERILRHIG